MEQENSRKKFSPSAIYQTGISELTDPVRLQTFLTFYAKYSGSLSVENMILLWKQVKEEPSSYMTMEEWNTQDRKVIYGETSHLRLYAPSGYGGRTELHEDQPMIALFHTNQTMRGSQYHKDTAEHPFSLKPAEVSAPSDEMLLQSCVNTALSCMQSTGCGMPIFEEPGTYVTLENPVRYDPGSNRLYIAKGASYEDAAFGLLRETLFCKLYQPNQSYDIYEKNRFQASCTAQVMMQQIGITKQFPLSIPSQTVTAQEMEQCLSHIPSGIQAMQQDYTWITMRLQEEKAVQSQATAVVQSYSVEVTAQSTEELQPVKSLDEKYNAAVEYVTGEESISVSSLQKQLHVGYARASRIMEQLEKTGVVAPYEGGGTKRKVLAEKTQNPVKTKENTQTASDNWDEALNFQDLTAASPSNSRHSTDLAM